MSELFDKDSDTIGWHLKNIYKSGELEQESTTEKYSVVRQEGKREVKGKIPKKNSLDRIKRSREFLFSDLLKNY